MSRVGMDVLFAGLPVHEFSGSYEWYMRLFGRPADVVAHEHEVMWRVTDSGWLYIVEDPECAGRSPGGDLGAKPDDGAPRPRGERP